MLRQAILRDAATGVWLAFSNPEAVLVARSVQDVNGILERIDGYCRQGGYAAGYLSYEAAPAMDGAYTCLAPSPEVPLAVFGLFARPVLSTEPGCGDREAASPEASWEIQEGYAEYARKIGLIRQDIESGNLYQVNYTLRLQGESVASADLFQRLVSSAPYGAYLELEGSEIVSGSPELFFRLDDDRLESAPMKGTVARGPTPADDARRRSWLQQSEKNRAENLMITDMVRNDVGRIARTGSVRAESVFDVQPLPTVWQMTSTVHARTDADLSGVFRGLFPAASITGAPKVASMALIRDLETSPRGIYTGAIGFAGPGGSVADGGLSAQFNVAIRTAWINKADGRAVYGAGGGIVWDSDAQEEYEEVAIKSRALTAPRPEPERDFELLETIGWSPGAGFAHLPVHLARLGRCAAHYGFPFDQALVQEHLDSTARELTDSREAHQDDGRWRVRLCINAQGAISVTSTPIELSTTAQPVMLAAEPVSHEDVHLTFKTTRRGVYERAAASVPDGVEALLWNDLGHVTESSIANLVYELDGRRFTPPLRDGLLPGVLREVLLREGQIAERALPTAELPQVGALHLVNGLRGWRLAELQAR